MKRLVVGTAMALSLAVAMFVIGAIGFHAGDSQGSSTTPGPHAASADTSALAVAAGDGQLDQTIVSLQERLRADPEWKSFASLGLAYLTKGRLTADPTYYPKAEAVLRRSLRLHRRGNFQASLGMAVLSAGRHDFSAALRWGRRAQMINPYNADVRGIVGDALVELGRYGAAGRDLQKMIDLRPELASYARVSYYRELHGDVAGAIDAMSTARDLAGFGQDAAWASYQLGELFFNSGRVRRAATEYRRAAYLAPGYPLPQAGLAKVAAARGDLERAGAMLSSVVRRYPSPEYVILLGDVYGAAGEHRKARQQYALVRAMQKLYEANGVDTDLEVALFDADHGIQPGRALARAWDEWRRRHSIHVADALAWNLYGRGRYGTAMRFSHRALRLGSRNALFRFHVGMIAARLGRRSAARRDLAAALRINPNFSFLHRGEARRVLRKLRGRP